MDINFLPQKSQSTGLKKDKNKKNFTEWSNPEKIQNKKKNDKISSEKENFSVFKKVINFLNKKKNSNPIKTLKDKLDGERKVEKSKKEILKFISNQSKSQEKNQDIFVQKNNKKKTDINTKDKTNLKKNKKNILSFLKNFFEHNDGDNKIFIDYQKAFVKNSELNQDKDVLNKPEKELRKIKSIISKENEEEKMKKKKYKVVKANKKSFLKSFLNIIKNDRKKKKGDTLTKKYKKEEVKKIEALNVLPDSHKDEKLKEKIDGKSSSIKNSKEKIKWETSQVLETNLIKGDAVVFFDWKKGVMALFVFVIFSCAIVGGAYFGLSSWGEKKEKEREVFAKEFDDLNRQIENIKNDATEALNFKKKLALVNVLFKNHVYWTNFFAFLEDNTVEDVYYLSFSGDNKGQYELSSIAKNFNTIEAQTKKMSANEKVIEVKVTEGNLASGVGNDETAGNIGFKLKLFLDKNIFFND